MSGNKKELTQDELEGLREYHISIDWKGITKAWKKVFYIAPFNLYKKSALKMEVASKKLMTGKAALLMPLGIVLRNTGRSMYRLAEGDGAFYYGARIIGGLSVIAAVAGVAYAAGPLLAATTTGAYIGSIASHIAVGAAALTALTHPVFTVATLTASTIASAAVAVFSTVVAAPLNFKAAYNRFKAAKNGIELTEDQIKNLETAFDKESPILKLERNQVKKVISIVRGMEDSGKIQVLDGLKSDFTRIAAKAKIIATTKVAPKPVGNTPKG